MSNASNRRRRRHVQACGLHGAARQVDCTPASRTKVLHGRDARNSYIPTDIDTNWTQARPADADIAYGRWIDPPEWAPDKIIPYAVLAGVKVNNNSRCTDTRPVHEEPKKSGNRVQDYGKELDRHASDQMNRLSYGDLLQHGIVQER